MHRFANKAAWILSQDELLKQAQAQVNKWQKLCSRLKEQHEHSMFSGIGG